MAKRSMMRERTQQSGGVLEDFGAGLSREWPMPARVLAGAGGAAIALYAFGRLRLIRVAFLATGAALIVRAITNAELPRVLGIARRAIRAHKSLTVAAPVSEVFDLWSGYENFPRFMSHVREVSRLSDTRSRWVVSGPAGTPIEWETEETARVPNEMLAWRTIGRSPVEHAGTVRFESTGEGSTRIDIEMSYKPPAGALGHSVAALLGADPQRVMDDDLARFKSLAEHGKARQHGRTHDDSR